jgi:DNA-binding NtrC family response regulator
MENGPMSGHNMSKRILVIDDDRAVRRAFALSLEDTGYELETAESGETGITKVQGSRYDLIFLDLKMPGMNGVQTLQEIRKIDMDVPVYIITAFHEEFVSQLKSAQQNGVQFELLRKPVDGKHLLMIVRGVLEEPTAY